MSDETLKMIADRLGVTAEKVFDVMVKQAYVARVSDAITVVLIFAFVLLSVWLLKYTLRKVAAGEWEEEAVFPAGLLCALAVFAIGWVLAGISMIVTAWLNPEAWALIRITEMIK